MKDPRVHGTGNDDLELSAPSGAPSVAIVAPPAAVGMSLMLPKDLFSVAAALGGGTVRLLTVDGADARCLDGTWIAADGGIAGPTKLDLVIVGAFWGSADDALRAGLSLARWLAKVHVAGTLVAATSTGTFFLAEVGLLDGKAATTYWPYIDTFRERYPAVDLRPERAMTDAGGVFCASGIGGGCDLVVAFIGRVHGKRIAAKVARRFLMDFNRAYEVAHLAFDGQKYHNDEPILSIQLWLEANLARGPTIEDLSRRAGMSARNFSRRFRQGVFMSATRGQGLPQRQPRLAAGR